MWDVLSGLAEMAWDVLSGAAKVAWDVLSGVTKLHGMFCPGWQIDAGCFVRGGKKWHGMFCPGWQKMAWDVLSYIPVRCLNIAILL